MDEARRDPALHLVALDGDVISPDGLVRRKSEGLSRVSVTTMKTNSAN